MKEPGGEDAEPLAPSQVELAVSIKGVSGTALSDVQRPSSAAAAAEDRLSDPDIAAFHGYVHRTIWARALFVAASVLSGGLLLLVCRWWLRLRVLLTLRPCWLGAADVVLVTLADGGQELATVTVLPGVLRSVRISAATSPHLLAEDEELQLLGAHASLPSKEHEAGVGGYSDRLLLYRCGRYVFSAVEQTFVPVPSLPKGFVTLLAHAAAAPNAVGDAGEEAERAGREGLYGANELAIPGGLLQWLLCLHELMSRTASPYAAAVRSPSRSPWNPHAAAAGDAAPLLLVSVSVRNKPCDALSRLPTALPPRPGTSRF